jgi:hypothetical protein
VGSQHSLGNDIDFPPEEILQSHEEARVVHEAPARLEVDQQVDIAARTRIAPGHGPEDTHVPRSEAGCDLEDLASLGSDVVRHSHAWDSPTKAGGRLFAPARLRTASGVLKTTTLWLGDRVAESKQMQADFGKKLVPGFHGHPA